MVDSFNPHLSANAVYEKKIDKVLAAGKPVAKELAVIFLYMVY